MFRISCWEGEWYFSRKVPVKNAYPPPRSTRKIWYSQKGHFTMFCFFFCVCKNGYPPPSKPLQNIHTPHRKPCKKRVPKVPPPPPYEKFRKVLKCYSMNNQRVFFRLQLALYAFCIPVVVVVMGLPSKHRT